MKKRAILASKITNPGLRHSVGVSECEIRIHASYIAHTVYPIIYCETLYKTEVL